MTKSQKFFSALGRFMKNIFTKNILLKVIALLFAILLWGYVISIEKPEYIKRVRDIEIGIVGESVLNSRGLMLVTRDTGTTDAEILCKINKHSELTASVVSCTVDLSNRAISLDDTEDSKIIPLEVTATVPTEFGTVQSLSVSQVELEVAKLSTRSNVQVSAKFSGRLPEGYTVEAPTNLSISTMTGRKSLLDQIVRGEVTVDLETFPINDPETLANTYDCVLPVQFYNSSNLRLDDIYASNGEPFMINVRVVIRAYKEVPIEPTIEMLEEGYTWSYKLSRSKIILYGDRTVLDGIDSIKTETITATPSMINTPMSANLIIPDGVETAQNFSKAITVTLTVEEMTDSKDVEIPITYEKIMTGTSLAESVPKTVTVKVEGPLSALDEFLNEWVTATVDLTGYAEGTVELPVRYHIDEKASRLHVTADQETVTVELIGPPAEEAE